MTVAEIAERLRHILTHEWEDAGQYLRHRNIKFDLRQLLRDIDADIQLPEQMR